MNQQASPLPLDTAWSLADDPDIANATIHPHLTLEIGASGHHEESFSFMALAGQTFTFDVDGAFNNLGETLDTILDLRTVDGLHLATDDDSNISTGGGGSSSGLDPYLTYSFTEDGVYTISLRSFGGQPLFVGTTARLSINLDGGLYVEPPVGALNADTLMGGGGNDWLGGEAGRDLLLGGDGVDALVGGQVADTLMGGDSEADLRDVIYGGAGDDQIDGGYGNDELRGGDDNDVIAGGFGADTVIGGAGEDTVAGAALGDLLFGGEGFDFLNGGFGHDRINGGPGADSFYHLGYFGHGSDWIQDYSGNEGDLLLFGDPAATRAQFQINWASTPDAGDAATQEAFVIYRPTGQIIWALIDGAANDHIWLQLGDSIYNLMA
ncbi:MAG: pre-peptidase C-terminal domain-containing protein [Rhodobacteraceae bacterium]|nr:pre-peptidase C-terminal domain-containing protein [Paracoccaceae bacterium]